MLKEKSSFSYLRVTIGWNRALIITAGIIKYRTNKCNAKQAWVTYPRWHQIWTIVLDISLLQTASCVWGVGSSWHLSGRVHPSYTEQNKLRQVCQKLGKQLPLVKVSLPWAQIYCWACHKLRKKGESQESGSMISDDTTKLRSSNRYGIGTKINTQTSGTEEGA